VDAADVSLTAGEGGQAGAPAQATPTHVVAPPSHCHQQAQGVPGGEGHRGPISPGEAAVPMEHQQVAVEAPGPVQHSWAESGMRGEESVESLAHGAPRYLDRGGPGRVGAE